MSLRFRRRFKLAPGLFMNVSRGGLSWSMGPRGASMTFGKRGMATNVGLPGTGLSFRQAHGSATGRSTAPSSTGGTVQKQAIVRVDDEGNVSFLDAASQEPLDEAWIAMAKRQAGDSIKALIAGKVSEINAAIDALGAIHSYMPAPAQPKYEKVPFDLPEPPRPEPKAVGLLGKFFASRRESVDSANAEADARWQEEMATWQQLKLSHEAREERRRKRAEVDVLSDVEAMEAQLEQNLGDITWPRETNVSFEVRSGGALCVVDVDMPEVEQMPLFEAVVTGRGFEVKKKELSETKRRKLYMQHIHSVALRIIGEVFATLPRCEKVVLSGYSQRPDRQTGQVRDEYLISLGVDRSVWREIDFSALELIDPVAAVARFEVRRDMTKSGIFRAIEPLI